MKTQQLVWTKERGWNPQRPADERPPTLVLLFGQREVLEAGAALDALAQHFPRQTFFGCSTAGEIENTSVHDGDLIATAVWLERATVHAAARSLADFTDVREFGAALAQALPKDGLRHVLALSDGTRVNGSELVAGITTSLPAGVELSGGLSGDGAAMKTTVVVDRGQVRSGVVVALGFCGALKVGIGSLGGWDAFGPERRVTKASGNVVYELDGESALALYKRYLGPHAAGLPQSALLFPLTVHASEGALPVVRTILGVNEADGSLTFAGDVPQGSRAQLMRANFERIIGGAFDAARATESGNDAELAILVSCVGRKLILKQRTEEEVEAVREVLGPKPALTGFYSYGELAPFTGGAACQLHNQTMTVTTFREV